MDDRLIRVFPSRTHDTPDRDAPARPGIDREVVRAVSLHSMISEEEPYTW